MSYSLNTTVIHTINKQIEESRARQEKTRKRQEAYSNMSLGERMMHEPLSMGQIIDNRM